MERLWTPFGGGTLHGRGGGYHHTRSLLHVGSFPNTVLISVYTHQLKIQCIVFLTVEKQMYFSNQFLQYAKRGNSSFEQFLKIFILMPVAAVERFDFSAFT